MYPQLAYYYKHRAYKLEYQKQYYRDNKKYITEYYKKYYNKKKELINDDRKKKKNNKKINKFYLRNSHLKPKIKKERTREEIEELLIVRFD
tara:strand:+ start:2174 stop:2446 length:273 start_codon:yes stop_codon:yes gene_type:complete